MTRKKKAALHILTAAVTVLFFSFAAYKNRYFYVRIGESLKDLRYSIVYYFRTIARSEGEYSVTVVNPSSLERRLLPLPETFSEFRVMWSAYWQAFVSSENVKGYLFRLAGMMSKLSYFLMLFAVPLFVVVMILIKQLRKRMNNDYAKDTKLLKLFKRTAYYPYLKIRKFVSGYADFLRLNVFYFRCWLVIALIVSNALTVILEALAYYIYFAVSFDFGHVYYQIYKLLLDLQFIFSFIPLPAWIIAGYVVFCKIRLNIGYTVLRRHEMINRRFIGQRPVSTEVVGTMGTGKTTAIVDLGLSKEVMFRDKALEKMIENDLKFPDFPWINLENELKAAMQEHKVFNLVTIDLFFEKKYEKWLANGKKDSDLFGYDTARYPFCNDDGLVRTSVWTVAKNYAKLYFIYIVESSLILSTFSVRSPMKKFDEGNLPLWTNDFFDRHSVSESKRYRYSHILDWDMLRLGCKVVENNPKADVLEFGVILITEIGKERGNSLENKEVKKKSSDANVKNDKFENYLKMIRHCATVDNYCFVSIFCDEQRASSLGANVRELCDVITISENEKGCFALPFFEVFDVLYELVFGKFSCIYVDYRFRRGDNSLLMFLFKKITCFFHDIHTKMHNTFGFDVLHVLIEKSMQEGTKRVKDKYYLSYKKLRSMRFGTDCLSGAFRQKNSGAVMGFSELPEYEFVMASLTELMLQNSYFVDEMSACVDLDESKESRFRQYMTSDDDLSAKTEDKT